MDAKIYVVGAGIIGICCAIALQRDGHKVVLIDKSGPGEGTTMKASIPCQGLSFDFGFSGQINKNNKSKDGII